MCHTNLCFAVLGDEDRDLGQVVVRFYFLVPLSIDVCQNLVADKHNVVVLRTAQTPAFAFTRSLL